MAELRMLDPTSTGDLLDTIYLNGIASGALTALTGIGCPDDEATRFVDKVMTNIRSKPEVMTSLHAEVMAIVAEHTIDIDHAVSAAESLANGSSS